MKNVECVRILFGRSVLAALMVWHLGGALLSSGAERPAATSGAPRKALVMGRGDPFREADGGPTHPQGAKTCFLKLVGNPANDPGKGWTCDLSWDLMVRLGMDPQKTAPETLFNYIGANHLGYRIVIQNSPGGHGAAYWDCAVDNGLMPFAPQGSNSRGFRVDEPLGLGAAVSVSGGSVVNSTSFGPSTEFIDALPVWVSHADYEDDAQSWANQSVAAKFAAILDAHPSYNIWDAREYLRQAASFWSTGWTETNGYGRVNEKAQVSKLLPGPPLEFQLRPSPDRHQVWFTWRNFLQSDFAATVIARGDGRVVYQGTGTNAVWIADHPGEETFTYWSRNRAGDTSRIETYQHRAVSGLDTGAYRMCLILGAPRSDEALDQRMRSRFLEVATNWVCEMVIRPGDPFYDKLTAFPYGTVAAVRPDFFSMVTFGLTNNDRILLVPASYADGDLYRFKTDWDRATAAGKLVVLPHHVSSSRSRAAQARRLSPPRLFSALTVGEGTTNNARSFGPGLECFDSPVAIGSMGVEPTQIDAAAVVAGKLAQILDANPGYNNWDARQHLRQSSNLYASGWVEDGGYGRPPARPAKIDVLDPAPPLEIQAQKSADGRSVTFSWENFLMTSFAETVITRHDGEILYHGAGTNFVWTSDVDGDETFKVASKDRSGRLSKSESYTVLTVTRLKAK
jgi:hypothetical protein